MKMITAPFNFVPLNEKVFFPDWAIDISHDKPFRDSISGEIELEITSKSPIFIKDSDKKEEFCNYKGEYFIPATSIKGMIRNVLEIMSFSKMSFVDDTTYSVRDLKYDKYMELAKEAKSGWLIKDENDNYKIVDSGEVYRIKYDEIDRYFGINFKNYFMEGVFNNAKSPYKKAEEKYKLLNKLTNKDILNETFKFSIAQTDRAGRKILKFDENGNIEGKLVLTGHPSPRRESGKKSGKIYDFVFCQTNKVLEVEKRVVENFKFAYFDGRDTQPTESPDWTFWKEKLNNGEKIPIFYHERGGKVGSFGLSYLYKFPYNHSLKKGLYNDHLSEELDLVEAIFGYVNDKNNSALKGRVFISHAKNTNNSIPLSARNLILGTPKASYYPIYLVQNGNDYKTMMDGFKIAGWKRYPIHKNYKYRDEIPSTQTTTLTPLPEESKFSFKIKLHNLKEIELGALFSAITFHNTKNTFHNIGLAKPYGYGKIEINIKRYTFSKDKEYYMKKFEAALNSEIFDNQIKWHKSEQISSLLTMATPQNDNNLKYMELKEFAKEKNDVNYLKRYIDLDGITKVEAISLIDENDIKNYQDEIKEYKIKNNKQKEKLAKEKEEKKAQERKKEEIKKHWENIKNSENIVDFENHISKYPDSFYLDEAIDKIEELKEKQANEQKEKLLKEIEEEWNKYLRADEKFKKDILERFIQNYPNDNIHLDEAKKTLESYNQTQNNSFSINFDTINNTNTLKNFISNNKNIDLAKLESKIVEIYNSLKGKKKKNFFKDIQLGRFIDKDFENKMKSILL